LKLLIVDDSVEMRRLIRSLVGDMASEVFECGGGDDAVKVYFEAHPDWVLMDLHMSGGDGLAATREIRKRDGNARIVIVTQFDEDVLRRAAAEAGALAYLLKENLLGIRRFLASESG
jgi:two-component system chemotaxis response regulator CheY